ncbi:WD repeat-containing protein 5-like [Oscarella lobularis]|uniref:WD repeat-containing protein 5-like n=1 Tax=Oscarella lobularis TaxID=121494 RepID=UPI0033132E68
MPLFKRNAPKAEPQSSAGELSLPPGLPYSCVLTLNHNDDDEVWTCKFSPVDDRLLLTTTYGKVTLWNLGTSPTTTRLAEIVGEDGYCSATFSPDGKSIACHFGNNRVTVGTIDAKKPLKKLKKFKPSHEIDFGNTIRSLEYGAQSNLLISASWDGQVILWKADKGKLISSIDICQYYKKRRSETHGSGLWSCSLSRDESLLAAASSTSEIYLIDSQTLVLKSTLTGHDSDVYHCEFGQRHAHQVLVSGSKDGTVRIWNVDVAGNSKCARVHETGFPVKYCLLSKKGNILAAGGDAFQVLLLDPYSGETIRSLKLDDDAFHHAVHSMSITESERYLAVAYTDSKVRVWQLAKRVTSLKNKCRLILRSLVDESNIGRLPISEHLKCYLQYLFD